MSSVARYAIGDLARLAGVSRRTVRYYVQEDLIPPPHGIGRGNHYGPEHLEQILRVKALQESGRTLDEIRRGPALSLSKGPDRGVAASKAARATEPADVRRSIWRRLTLAPGIELQIASHVRLPSPSRLNELAEWCRLHLTPDSEEESDDA